MLKILARILIFGLFSVSSWAGMENLKHNHHYELLCQYKNLFNQSRSLIFDIRNGFSLRVQSADVDHNPINNFELEESEDSFKIEFQGNSSFSLNHEIEFQKDFFALHLLFYGKLDGRKRVKCSLYDKEMGHQVMVQTFVINHYDTHEDDPKAVLKKNCQMLRGLMEKPEFQDIRPSFIKEANESFGISCH